MLHFWREFCIDFYRRLRPQRSGCNVCSGLASGAYTWHNILDEDLVPVRLLMRTDTLQPASIVSAPSAPTPTNTPTVVMYTSGTQAATATGMSLAGEAQVQTKGDTQKLNLAMWIRKHGSRHYETTADGYRCYPCARTIYYHSPSHQIVIGFPDREKLSLEHAHIYIYIHIHIHMYNSCIHIVSVYISALAFPLELKCIVVKARFDAGSQLAYSCVRPRTCTPARSAHPRGNLLAVSPI